MKCAFLILVHKNPEQVNLLLKQLLIEPENYLYIHISKLYRAAVEHKLLKNHRIKILVDSILVSWGNDGILKAQLLLLQHAIKDNMDYVCFLTGQDLQIKRGINKYLSENKNSVFINPSENQKGSIAMLEYDWPKKYLKLMNNKMNPTRLLRRLRLELAMRNFPLKKKMISKQLHLKYYRSYFWVAFPIYVGKYLIEVLSERDDLKALFFNSLCPEERFWSTLIMHSPYKEQIIDHRETLVYISEFVNNHPKIIKYEDIEMLESKNHYFARKFEFDIDSKVIHYYYNHITKRK